MAKVAIVTYHFVPNYGAALQAWGLQKFLSAMGHDPYFVDYRPAHLTTGGRFWWPTDAWRRRADVVIAYMKLQAIKRAIRGDGGKRERFEQFHEAHLALGDTRYRSLAELKRTPPEADAYVCGSDQIWNASQQRGIDPAYFLPFAPAGVKRISYAASFGRPEVPERFQPEVAELLRPLDAISVRERSGQEIVKQLTGRDADWVLDPTLMVEDGFPEAVAPARDEKYLFSYTLRSRELVAEVEQNLQQRFGLDLVSPTTLAADPAGAPGPLEWLGYIKHARFVVTNSYHGTLFSIIFRKPFIFVGLAGAKAGFNERALSILDGLGLADRMIMQYDPEAVEAMASTEPDWQSVGERLADLRSRSCRFLQEAIS